MVGIKIIFRSFKFLSSRSKEELSHPQGESSSPTLLYRLGFKKALLSCRLFPRVCSFDTGIKVEHVLSFETCQEVFQSSWKNVC